MVSKGNASRLHRLGILLLAAVLAGVSLRGWAGLRFDTSVLAMLPEDSEARRAVLFLQDSTFAAKAVLWFRAKPEANISLANLMAAADDAAGRLDARLIRKVIRPPDQKEALREILLWVDRAGELLQESELAELEAATEPEALARSMRKHYMQMLKPEGAFLQPVLQRDPLGVGVRILGRMQGLTQALGYRTQVEHGHLVHPDGGQLILVLETAAAATDIAGSHQLADHLQTIARSAPAGVEIIPICGHLHTAHNDERMQADIMLVGLVDAIGFGLVFFLFFRDWRSAAIFLLPMAAIATSIGLTGLRYPVLSAMVIGLSATMAGSAVDYGIHVYTAIRTGSDPQRDVREVRRPLMMGMLITSSVFVAFCFSRAPAYRQLGCMATVSLLLAALGAMFVLPLVVKPGNPLVRRQGMALPAWAAQMKIWAAALLALTALGATAASMVRFDADLTKLDGTAASVIQQEKEFQRTWNRNEREMAIVAVTAADRSQAERRSDAVYRKLSSSFEPGAFVSLSSVWPSADTRQSNQQRWMAFWSPQRQALLQTRLAEAGTPLGFHADAFAPFLENLRNLNQPSQAQNWGSLLGMLEPQFVVRTAMAGGVQGWSVLSYFPDTDANVARVRQALQGDAEAQVVSRRALGQAFAESTAREGTWLAAISGALILGWVVALTRSVRWAVLTLLPALVGLTAMLASMKLTGIPLNLATMIAVIAAMGLSIDYGVFTVHAWRHGGTTLGHGMASVHLSSLTTLIGASSLLFARHPALFQIGVTLTVGLSLGYLAAIVVVPAGCLLVSKKEGASPA